MSDKFRSKADSPSAVKSQIESMLLVTSKPISINKLAETLKVKPKEIEEQIELIAQYFNDNGNGIRLLKNNNQVQLASSPENSELIETYLKSDLTGELTKPSLETLTIVAYRQPITAPEIQELRGRNSAGVLKTLLERRMVRIAGRKDVVGRPFLYATTRDFLLHFGLRSIAELPPLEEFEESYLTGGDFSEPGDARPADREEEVLQQLALVDDGGDSDEDEVPPAGGDHPEIVE